MTTQPHDRVAITVVRFLGTGAILGLAGVIFLVFEVTRYETIDPSTVALVAGVSTLVGTLTGALGSILATTGKGSPVTVDNSPDNPLPVQPVYEPEPGDL